MKKIGLRHVLSVALMVAAVMAKPNQLQEERREYQYQRSHKVTSTSTLDGGNAGYYNSRLGNYQTQDSSMAEWAQRHQEQVRRMTEQMRMNNLNAATTGAASMTTGGRGFSTSMAMTNAEDCDNKPTAFSYSFAGKSKAELDELAKTMTQQMIEELHNSQRHQSTIVQPAWYLHHGAQKLLVGGSEVEDLQQQQQQIFSEDDVRHATHGSRYTGGGGYSQQSFNRENYERTQEKQQSVPVVVSGYTSSQSKKEEEERYRSSYRPQPTQVTTSQSQSSNQQSEHRSQTVYPTPILVAREHNQQSTGYESEHRQAVYPTPTAMVREHNQQSAEYERESLAATPTTIPVHSNSYFSQSLNERHRQYQRPRPLESASSTYHSQVEEEESRQRQVPIVMPLAHNSYTSSSSSQVNKETESVPVVPQPSAYNYGREHEESSYTRDRTYVKPTVSSTIQRQQQQQHEVIVETITHKPIINTGVSHQIYNYKAETDLKVSPLYKPAYVEKSHHEKFEEEQMRLRQQQQQRPVVTVTSQKEETESSRQRYRGQPQPVLHHSASSTSEAEDLQQVQQVVFEQPAVGSLHTEMTEEERRRVIHQQRPTYGSYSTGFNRTEESVREQRPVAAPVVQIATSHVETEEEREYRRQHQNPGQTIHTTTIEERNEEMRRRQQQQAAYDRRYAVSGYNRSEVESSYSGGQYQSGVAGGQREYTLEERERMRQSGGGGYYMQTGYTKEEEERRRLEYEQRRQQAIQTSYGVSESGGSSSSSHLVTGQREIGGQRVEEVEEVQFNGSTAEQDKTVYTSSFDGKDEDDGQQKLVEIDETVTDSTEKSAKTIISKDRGDQPPQTFEEDYESEEVLEAEPGIGYYPADKKPEVGLLRSTSRPRTTTANPYYSAPLAPYTREHEKRRYESSSQQVQMPASVATETEEYRRHYQRTQQQHQYTSGNLYPQPKHAQQHELENVLTEETSELSVGPRPAVQTASQTLHQMAGAGSSSSSSSGSSSVTQNTSGRTNYNTQRQESQYGREHESEDLQQQQIAIFDVNSTDDADRGQSTVEWSSGGAQTNEKYAEVDNQEREEQRREADGGNSTWNHESTFTFNVEKEIDGDDYDNVQQQVQDMAKEFEDIGQQEIQSLTQRREDHHQRSQQLQQHNQSSYGSHSGGYAAHNSYEHLEAQEKDHVEEPAPEVTTTKSGFWRRFRNKAKDLVG